MEPISLKRAMLVFEAKRWVGIKEVGGDNRGQMVELFQKAVNPNPCGESWCVDFIWYGILNVDAMFSSFFPDEICAPSRLQRTESVMKLFTGSPIENRAHDGEVEPGDIVCWQFYDDGGRPTGLGHAEIVIARDGIHLTTVGGNTSSGDGIHREGDGVYVRQRVIANSEGHFRILGFLKPWV